MRGLLSILLDLPHYLRLAWRLMKDSRVPWRLKLFVVAAVLYGISPIDLLPEALNPLVGFGEDFLILLVSLWNLIRNSPPEVVKQHAREITREITRDGESDDGDQEGQE